MDKVRVGVLGAGVIANNVYFPGISKMAKADWIAVCDNVGDRAQRAAEQYNVPKYYTDMDRFLADPDIELVVNLTHIQAHYATNMAILQAGKHVYSEKTMTVTVDEATNVIEEARKRNLKLGAAACTMLRPAYIKVKELIDAGAIGRLCYLQGRHSHFSAADFEPWATDPTWFHKPGAGPILDLGVYGLHAYTGMVGPAKKVACLSGISIPQRKVRAGPAKGKIIDVEVDDNSQIMLDFGNATFGYLDATYCQKTTKGPRMAFFYGSEGTITINDPADPHPISLFRDERDRYGFQGWTDIDLPRGSVTALWQGVEHLIDCIQDPTKKIITSGEHARHVIEIINKAYQSAREDRILPIETTF